MLGKESRQEKKMDNINFNNIYDAKLASQGFYYSCGVSEIEQEMQELSLMVVAIKESLDKKIKKDIELEAYYKASIDNLLLLISFLQESIVILQEYHLVDEAKIVALEKVPWYRKITIRQREQLLKDAEEKAKKEYSYQKTKRLTEIREIVDNIQKRRAEE